MALGGGAKEDWASYGWRRLKEEASKLSNSHENGEGVGTNCRSRSSNLGEWVQCGRRLLRIVYIYILHAWRGGVQKTRRPNQKKWARPTRSFEPHQYLSQTGFFLFFETFEWICFSSSFLSFRPRIFFFFKSSFSLPFPLAHLNFVTKWNRIEVDGRSLEINRGR